MTEPRFDEDGAQRFRCALSDSETQQILAALAGLPSDTAGVRIAGASGLASCLAATGAMGAIAEALIGPDAFPVRAVLFDKTVDRNWSLAWHQDRTIVVKRRIDTPDYGPWSIKAGLQHVAPPFEILAGMATLRLHLDPVDSTNAPLFVALGSHRLGRLTVDRIAEVVDRLETLACFAEAGDVWAYSTPILHASEAAARPARRRVLQVDYAARTLDGDLEWLGLNQGRR